MPQPKPRTNEAQSYRPTRAVTARRLALAKRYVEEDALNIARQRRISSDLDRRGRAQAAMSAREHLATLEQTQAVHLVDRDRLQAELDAFGPP
jgi:hypothetical protein